MKVSFQRVPVFLLKLKGRSQVGMAPHLNKMGTKLFLPYF